VAEEAKFELTATAAGSWPTEYLAYIAFTRPKELLCVTYLQLMKMAAQQPAHNS